MIHSLLHKHKLSATTNSGSENEITVPLILQSRIITSLACCGWSSDSDSDISIESCDCRRSMSKASGWHCWQYGLSQLRSVPSIGYLHGQQATLATWLAKSSVRETKQDQNIQHGNGYLAEGMYWANMQAVIHYNKLTSVLAGAMTVCMVQCTANTLHVPRCTI